MSILEFLQANIDLNLPPVIVAVILGIIWLVVYDFYHLIFTSVLSWFKKR